MRRSLRTSPALWISSGYFTMALTSMTLTSASAIMFKNLGMDNAQAAGYASLLLLIYTIKPLFAPLVETYRSKKFFVLCAQIAVGMGFLGAALVMGLPGTMGILITIFLLISFCGAIQDIASDGVYVTSLSSKAQSLYCGVQSLSWSIGPIVVSGGLVYLSGWLHTNYFHHEASAGAHWIDSWRIVFSTVGLVILGMAAWHAVVMPDGAHCDHSRPSVSIGWHILLDAFGTFFRKRAVWRMIAFAFFFRSSIGLLERIGPFFMVDPVAQGGLGLSNEWLGIIYGTYGLGAFLLGSLLGGMFINRRDLRPLLLFQLCCAVNIPGLAFLLMSIYQPDNLIIVTTGVAIEKFFFGFGSVAYMVYLMQQLAPGKYPTTHYAFGTAFMALCMMVTGAISGYLQELLGYISYFWVAMIAIIPSLLVTWFAPFPNNMERACSAGPVAIAEYA